MTNPAALPISFAAPGDFPWSAVIVCGDGSIASGAVVAPGWVLTCAHVPVKQFDQVMIGGGDLSLRDGTFWTVERVRRNPDYDKGTHVADLALLRLYAWPDGVQPLTIAEAAPDSATEALLVGWGQASVGDPAPGDLRQIELKMETIPQLAALVAGTHGPGIFPHTPADGRVSYGDSGAPLLVNGEAVALMSFRIENTDEDASILLPPYLQWINDEIG